ncbi:hypothetical protein BMS3Bbin10_00803 [bacterium BMS3Bbin10]|nr:hypothetical protein BMS3Bbin10_00803 [bacterium BMS3Bbin10]
MVAGRAFPVQGGYAPAARPLSAQSLGLALTWLTLASSSVVFAEPAPYDALMIGLIALLPLLGLVTFSKGLILFLAAWLVIGATGLIAAGRSGMLDVSVRHTAITIFLSISAVLVAAFVRKNPERHTRIIVSGLLFASLLAVLTGAAGYFDMVPGANELFTKYGRMRGTFKDPNVFGPFIVPALLYCVHSMATAKAGRAIMMSLLAGLFCLGLLVSFSRGAWFNAGVALLVYAYMMFVVARSNLFRVKFLMLAVFAACCAVLVLAAAMQIESIGDLVRERASLTLSYDTGPEGRFGGQLLALETIASHPMGIGAREFARILHGQDVHNVYLSMFLNAGWIGGFVYLTAVLATLAAGFRYALRANPMQGIFIVMLAAFAGLAAEGMIVDTDHWRHFYVIMGLIWGLMLSNPPHGRPGPCTGAGICSRSSRGL